MFSTKESWRRIYLPTIVLLLFTVNILISFYYIKIHGFLKVDDGYYNYAVSLKIYLFGKSDTFTSLEGIYHYSYPVKFRILYPFIIASISSIFDISLKNSNIVFSIIIIIFFFYLLWKAIRFYFPEEDNRIFIFLYFISLSSLVIFTLKFSVDILFATGIFASIYFFLKFKETRSIKYFTLTSIFTIFSILTKELGFFLILLFIVSILRDLKLPLKYILLIILFMFLASFIVLVLIAGERLYHGYEWYFLLVTGINDKNIQLIFKALSAFLVYLFSSKSIAAVSFALFSNFFSFFFLYFSYLLFAVFNNKELKLKNTILSKFREIFSTIKKSDRIFLPFIFSFMYFIAIYTLQASFFNERYLLPIVYWCYLTFLFFNQNIIRLNLRKMYFWIIIISLNYLSLILRLILITFVI